MSSSVVDQLRFYTHAEVPKQTYDQGTELEDKYVCTAY